MHAAKHFDPQIGIDIHMTMLGPFGPFPLPTAHLGIVLDPFDYIPIIGGTVQVNGVKRATAGTGGLDLHIPLGIWMPPAELPAGPQWDDEIFMGSMTVVADGDPLSRIAMPVLDCNIVGLINPFRLRKPKKPQLSMSLPTAVNLAIPNTVFVGGPPMISIMGMAFKGAFATLGRLARTKFAQRMFEGAKGKWSKLFANMEPGFLKCKVLRAEPVDIRSGAVSVTHEDFRIPGRLPLAWTRHYRSDAVDEAGVCGWGWTTPADLRLEVDEDGVVFHPLQGPPAVYERLPLPGEVLIDHIDGAHLSRAQGPLGDELHLRTRDDLVCVFAAPPVGHLSGPLRIERLADLCGNAWTFERDGEHLVRIHERGLDDSPGRFVEVSGQGGRIHAMALHDPLTGASFPLVRYRQDMEGDLVAALDALDAARTFEYLADHRMVRHSDRVGLSFHYAYDDRSRVVHAWGDGGLYDYRFDYHDELYETEVTDSLGHTSLVRFSAEGLPLCEIDPLGGCTFFEYDDWGRTTAAVDPAGLRTEFRYNATGDLVELKRPDDTRVAMAYEDGRLVETTDADGGRWKQVWNAHGLLVSQVTPLGATTLFEHDARGQLRRHSNARGAVTAFDFDRHGQLTAVTDALGRCTRFDHDAMGRLLRRTDAGGRVTTQCVDAKGRLREVQLPGGATVRCEHDAEDRPVRWTDERGCTTTIEYTGLGQVACRRQPDGLAVRYRYDTEERLTGLTNQRGESFTIVRDPLGRIVKETDYWGQVRRYEYDAASRLVRSTDPLGRPIEHACDAMGRIVRKTLPGTDDQGRTVVETFRYGKSGQLLEMRNPSAHVLRRFDADGRLVEEVQNGFKVEHGYDAVGNRTLRRSTAGHTLVVGFDLVDQPVHLQIDDGTPVEIERNALGQAVRERLGRQLERTLAYDARGLLAAQAVHAHGTQVVETRWQYDAAGHLARRSDSLHGEERYACDPMGRIVAHTDPSGRLRDMPIDPAGERLRTTVHETQMKQVVGAGTVPPLWTREGVVDGHHVVFDRAGNLVARSRPGEPGRPTLHLCWDANQRMTHSRWDGGADGGRTTHYGYDPLGRRVFKRTGSKTTLFFWDGDALLCEVEHDGTTLPATSGGKLVDLLAARRRADALAAAYAGAREYVYRPGSFVPLASIQRLAAAPMEAVLPAASAGRRQDEFPKAGGTDTASPASAAAPPPRGLLGQLGSDARLGGWTRRTGTPSEPPAPAPAEHAAASPTGPQAPPAGILQASGPRTGAALRMLVFHNDINGQPLHVTDLAGTIVWSAAPDAHGGLRGTGDTGATQPLRLQGQYHDAETGLHYNRYRYYEPRIGAYAGQDPLRYGGGLNLYGYAPNVYAGIDPLGLATRPIDRAVDYEQQIRDAYGSQPFSARQYQSIVDGKVVNGIADNVAVIDGRSVAIEAKYVDDWSSSIRNPASAIGSRGFAEAEQLKVIQQAKAYSGAFDEVIYHSNSAEFIAHYSKKFDEAGIDNYRFVHTPCL